MFAQPLARFLAGLIPDGTALPILAGPLKGRKWKAGSAPGPSKGLSVLLNRSEPQQLAAADRLLTPGSLCFDIGAHAGLYSLIFASRARLVYAFEPLPENIARLCATLTLNAVKNVRVVPFAVGGGTGATSFTEGAHSSEGRLDPAGRLPVFSITLGEFSACYGAVPDLIKIDVEGAEVELLKAGAPLLREKKPALLLSTHGDALKAESLRLLRDLGYAEIEPLDGADIASANEFAVTAPR